MPLWAGDNPMAAMHLQEAVGSILNQTDPDWSLVIVDDCSTNREVIALLARLKEKYPGKIEVISQDINLGPGTCRNIGIECAARQDAPFVLFNDADDISYPYRLELVKEAFRENLPNGEPGVVYSSFDLIGEDSNPLADGDVPPSILEILDRLRDEPPIGEDVWIQIATRTGLANLTSATAVSLELAAEISFPPERVSEDWHTWIRYSAGGGRFVFIPEPLVAYRLTPNSDGSASRSREGGKNAFYEKVVEVNTRGFREAVETAIKNLKIDPTEEAELLVRFYLRMARTMIVEQMGPLAGQLVAQSAAISGHITDQVMAEAVNRPVQEFLGSTHPIFRPTEMSTGSSARWDNRHFGG